MGGIARTAGRRLPILLSELHAATQYVDPVVGPRRGWRFEQLVAQTLIARGFPVRAVAGGLEICGTLPLSGFRHQIDAEISCRDAQVIGEWKAYQAPVPKNDVLLFKAKTDDIYEGFGQRKPARPILRVFGIAGTGSPELRIYAARHGIALVERDLWPAPVLADPLLRWPDDAAPSRADLRRLRYMFRPLQDIYRAAPNGRLTMPPALPKVTAEALLATQRRWSQRLDALIGWKRGAA